METVRKWAYFETSSGIKLGISAGLTPGIYQDDNGSKRDYSIPDLMNYGYSVFNANTFEFFNAAQTQKIATLPERKKMIEWLNGATRELANLNVPVISRGPLTLAKANMNRYHLITDIFKAAGYSVLYKIQCGNLVWWLHAKEEFELPEIFKKCKITK